MGICSSCESTNVATAKVILLDGRLQEYGYPVRVSQVLEKNPRCFVCTMDDMDFDSFISAINGEQELQPGRLYFALPMSWLKSPLSGEKMVSLAAKASLALKMSGGGGGRCLCGKRDDFMADIISNIALDSTGPKTVVGGGTVGGHGGVSMAKRGESGGRGGGGGRGRHTKKLSAILEE